LAKDKYIDLHFTLHQNIREDIYRKKKTSLCSLFTLYLASKCNASKASATIKSSNY